MTIARQLEERGYEKGRIEGLRLGEEKGRAEGELNGRLEIARRLLKQGMSPGSVKEVTGLSDEELSHIHR